MRVALAVLPTADKEAALALLDLSLAPGDLRVDCPEHKPAAAGYR